MTELPRQENDEPWSAEEASAGGATSLHAMADYKANSCIRNSPRNIPLQNCEMGSSCIICFKHWITTFFTGGRNSHMVSLPIRTSEHRREYNNANRCLRISPRNTPVENCDVGSSCIGCLTELNMTGCTNGRDTNIVCLQNRTFGSSREHNNISSVFPKAPVERWCDCEECSQFIWRFLPEELN